MGIVKIQQNNREVRQMATRILFNLDGEHNIIVGQGAREDFNKISIAPCQTASVIRQIERLQKEQELFAAEEDS